MCEMGDVYIFFCPIEMFEIERWTAELAAVLYSETAIVLVLVLYAALSALKALQITILYLLLRFIVLSF